MKTYTISGKPISLLRPHLSTTYRPHVYDPQKDLKEEAQLELSLQHKKLELIEGPMHLDVTFFMQIPASYRQTQKDSLHLEKHSKRPDLSNLIKYAEDVAQGIIFHDDAKIQKITAQKIYSKQPRTEFTITEISNEE